MRAPGSRRQRTFYVGDEKITVVSARITRSANHCGWSVRVNGSKPYRLFVLGRREAEDMAYVRWVGLTGAKDE